MRRIPFLAFFILAAIILVGCGSVSAPTCPAEQIWNADQFKCIDVVRGSDPLLNVPVLEPKKMIDTQVVIIGAILFVLFVLVSTRSH